MNISRDTGDAGDRRWLRRRNGIAGMNTDEHR
jgi:hypothetical protein